jgi:hypothetical protein
MAAGPLSSFSFSSSSDEVFSALGDKGDKGEMGEMGPFGSVPCIIGC